MLHIGYHESTSNGLEGLGIEALEVGADTFAFFTRNPRGGKAKDIDPSDAEKLNALRKEHNFAPPVAHAPYTMNPCSADEGLRQYALEMMIDDFLRLEYTPGSLYNFHPGSHLNMVDVDTCLSTIAESINMALEQTSGVTAVIENTAGQGSNLGFDFEHIAKIIDKVDDKSRVGVCIDSCHAFAAGYDLSSDETFNAVWNDFDRTIGFNYLRGMHLNDTKKGLASKVDRHESIGKGILGQRFFQLLMNDSRFDNIPLILETPNPDIWAEEIKWLYEQEKK